MGEQKCVVSVCCCGCSLRSGSLAIGIVYLIFAILAAINGILQGIGGNSQGWIEMAINIIQAVLCVVLILGINKENRAMIMVWVWVSAIIVIVSGIVTIMAIIGGFIVVGIILLVCLALQVYFIIVVRSHALTLSGPSTVA